MPHMEAPLVNYSERFGLPLGLLGAPFCDIINSPHCIQTHQIQQPIPKLRIRNSREYFNQSDCFWRLKTMTNKLNRRKTFVQKIVKIRIREFGICSWIWWEIWRINHECIRKMKTITYSKGAERKRMWGIFLCDYAASSYHFGNKKKGIICQRRWLQSRQGWVWFVQLTL